MLVLKRVEWNDGKIVFNYYPEGKDSFGSISVDENSGELNVLRIAENDEFENYKVHAITRIREYFENRNFLQEDVVSWY